MKRWIMERTPRLVLSGLVVTITLAILLPAAVTLAQTVSFGARTAFAVGSTPYSVAIGDLNGDGRPDLAVPNEGSSTVSILLGTGAGAFGAATDFTVGTQPHSVAIGDLNGDGKPDLAVVNHLSYTVSILLGTGTGAFGAATDFAAGTLPYSVAIGDLNGDGKPDLAVTNGWGSAVVNTVSILLGTGTGAFGPPTAFAVGTTPDFVAIGDLNGDGKPDLAVSNFSSNSVSVLLGTGTGAFGPPTDYAVGTFPYAVAIGDLNGDGKPDLAVANSLGYSVSVLLGTGTGTFGPATDFAAGAYTASVAISDFNGDGKPDLAAANANNGTVSILSGDGTGAFGAATNVSVGGTPYYVAIGDLDGDGKPDLAVANTGGNTVSIVLNTTTYSPSGAFGGATSFAVGTQPTSVAIGDLNGDGKPDLAVANELSNTVSILLGTGTGAFGAATSFAVGGFPTSIAIGDLNGDGKPDLAVANQVSNTVSILLGTGTGAFGAATSFAVGSLNLYFVAIGDLNGDGKPDLAMANDSSSGGAGAVSILLGTGTGAFGAATNFATGASPRSVAIGDLNGDGKPDLAVANWTSNTVSVLLGIGAGAFGAATNHAVGTNPRSVAIGDLNGDGKPDLAVANNTGPSGTVSILLGTGTGTFGAATDFAAGISQWSVAIGDLNGDGKPDLAVTDGYSNTVSILLGTGTGAFGAVTAFAAGTGPVSVAIGDLNGDGKPDLAVTNILSSTVSILLNIPPVLSFTLSVSKAGTGGGMVTSSPAGITCGATCSAPFVSGTVVTLTATPDATSTFTGWSGACTGTGTCTVTMSAAQSVTATFTRIQYTLSVTKAGTGGGTVSSSPAGINCGATCSVAFTMGTVVTLTATPDATSTFAGWSGACTGTGSCVVTMDAAKAVTATFTVTQSNQVLDQQSPYTNTGFNGFVLGERWQQEITAGISGQLVGVEVYAFSNVGPPGRSDLYINMGPPWQSDANSFQTIAAPSANGWVYIDTSSANINLAAGDHFVLGISGRNEGEIWFGGSSPGQYSGGQLWLNQSNYGDYDLAFRTYMGSGVQTFALSVTKSGTGSGSVTSSPAGINCGATCSASFGIGTIVTLTATPDGTSTFGGWSGACTGTGSCVVTMDAAKSVTATFTRIQYTLSVTKAGSGGGTVSSSPAGISCGATCSAAFDAGTVVTLTAIPDATSSFTGWSGACSGIAGCTVTMNAATSVTATFNATAGTADLAVTKAVSPDPVTVNTSMTYTMVVTNNGPSRATGVTLTDPLPPGVTFVSAASSRGSCSEAAGTVTCTIGRLGSGRSATVTIIVTPTGVGPLTNTACVAGNEPDPNPDNDCATAPTTVNPPTLNTPAGSGVSVPLGSGLTVTFDTVSTEGTTTLTIVTSGPAPPTSFRLGTLQVYYDLNTTATFSGPITICFTYDDSQFSRENRLKLFHYSGSTWTNVTTTLDTTGNVICGTTTSLSPFVVVEPDLADLTNISTRARVLTGDDVQIGGFIIGGSVPKTVLIRARGPSMSGAPFNVPGTLVNPFVQLYAFATGTFFAQNDNWQTTDPLCGSPAEYCGDANEILATGLGLCLPNPMQTTAPPGCAQESAIFITLPPGNYGAIVSGVSGGTGVGLVEVFEVDTGTAVLGNISTRVRVETGDNVEIGGFIIQGSSPKQVLIRARGPSMGGAPFNVPATLANPFVQLYSFATGTFIAQNDNWQVSDPLCAASGLVCGGATEISATGLDPCMPNPEQISAPPGCAQESAILITLPPGNYGAIVSGVSDGTGVGLVEVFETP